MPLDDELACELDALAVLDALLEALTLLEALALTLLDTLALALLEALELVPLALLEPLELVPLALVPEALVPEPLDALLDPEAALLLLAEVSSLLPPTPPVPPSSPQAATSAARDTTRPETAKARRDVRCDMRGAPGEGEPARSASGGAHPKPRPVTFSWRTADVHVAAPRVTAPISAATRESTAPRCRRPSLRVALRPRRPSATA